MAHASFSKAKECSSIGGFIVGRGVEVIIHLQFGDDTTRWEEVVVLKRTLWCIELSSGLKINLDNGHGLL